MCEQIWADRPCVNPSCDRTLPRVARSHAKTCSDRCRKALSRWMPPVSAGCVFCGIVAGTEPASFIRTWNDAMAFIPHNPVTPGHTLVIPRTHVTDATEDPWVTGSVMARAAELARNWPASNILASNGRAATQSVMHLHVHVVPRKAGDQLMVPWGTTGNPHDPHRCKGMDRLTAELETLRAHMRSVG